jgi:very-short-patch-repair endonuclease
MEKDEQTIEFIRKAREVHGDTYDYSKVQYKKAIEKVIIICKTHGEFLQTPNGHLCGSGCIKCVDRTKRRSNIEEFIEKANDVHGDTYDYSKVQYKKAIEKVIIICKTHGEFLQTPNGHLCGSGCIKCVDRTKRRSNIEEFIEKANDVHGDTYDYSKFNYINCKTKGIIICKQHGEFTQHASNHLLGKGCSKCAGVYKYTTNEFIEKAKEIHGDIYDYSKFNYIDSKTSGIIICKTHGEFLQSPVNHYISNGCINCLDRGKALRYDTLQFIEKAKEIHGDTYDYSKVNYISSQSNVIIICKIHGNFLQCPVNHLQRRGCQKCAGKYQPSTEEFIERAKKIHGDKYDYSNVIYKTAKEKIIVICKIHGDFEQIPDCHLRGNGCDKCAWVIRIDKMKYTKDDFLEKANEIHRDRYDYSNINYVDLQTKIEIICKKHGSFLQRPATHIEGHGCPICVNKTEAKLYEIMKQIYPSLISQFKKDWCKRINHLPFDFCIPECKIIIELDGAQHFRQVRNWSSPEEQFENDKYKEECANQNGYSVIRLLQEDVFDDTYDWVKELTQAIEEIKSSEGITNIYLCKNGEYDNY